MKQEIKCKHCGSKEVYKKGFRKTKNRGKIQKFYCKDYHRLFTFDDGFYGMKTDSKIITMPIDMYLSNLSSRKMRNQLKRHFQIKRSHQTILNWIYKYVLKVHNFVNKLDYNLGNSFYANETEINRKGKNDQFWCCVDWNTRLITGFHYSLNWTEKEAEIFLFRSIMKGKPKSIQTDGAPFYPKAFKKLFYSNKIGGMTVEHKIQNFSETRVHNYKIETDFTGWVAIHFIIFNNKFKE